MSSINMNLLLLEYWEPIPGFESYQASYSGKIRHLGKWVGRGRNQRHWIGPRILKGSDNGIGYLRLTISDSGKRAYYCIHYLVAFTFIPNPYSLSEINHKNSNKSDNSVANLEWTTHLENMRHMWAKIKNKVA